VLINLSFINSNSFEDSLDLSKSNDVEVVHENKSVFCGNHVRFDLCFVALLHKHATKRALGRLNDVNIISDLELGLGLGDKHVVLISSFIDVEENLDAFAATSVVALEQALVVGPLRGIHCISEIDKIVEGCNLVSWNHEGA
jgi:hypothetical protein